MRLFRVYIPLPGGTSKDGYALADSFDHAAELLLADLTTPRGPVTVEDLGEPLQWDAPAEAPAEPEIVRPTAAQIRKSVQPDKLISFEDGKGYKTLKRHLTIRGLTPAEYRSKWGLPVDYPMVSPEYSERRAQLARDSGLGRK